MNRIIRPLSSRWAMVVLAAAALALSGCGRKGPLDLPPNAQAAAEVEVERPASQGSVFDPSYGTDAQPTAPRGRKKAFVLDPLLD